MIKKNSKIISIIMIGMLLFLTSSYFSAVSAKGLGYRWSSKTASVQFNVPFNDVWKDAIQAAMNTWNNVPDANTSDTATHLPQLSITSSTVSNKFNTINSTAYTWSGLMTPTSSNGILSSVLITNNLRYTFNVGAAADKLDIQVNNTHELGHALGVAHCHELNETHNSGDSANTMYPNVYFKSTSQRSLESYDTASVQLIYWN